MTREDKVKEFQDITGEYKGIGINRFVDHRYALIAEETEEVLEALEAWGNFEERDREHLLKELCDLQYVLSGTVVAFRLEGVFDEAFDRVHKSNMAKVEGEITIDENGKIMKPIGWKKPSLKDLV